MKHQWIPLIPERLCAASDPSATAAKEFAADVEYYLTLEPRQLPSRYLYDPLGSALFDAIPLDVGVLFGDDEEDDG